MKKLTPSQLDNIKNAGLRKSVNWIKVGMSTCGIAAGADHVFDVLIAQKTQHRLDVEIKRCGCAGMCYAEPLVEVCVHDMPQVVYGQVDADTAILIIEKHVIRKQLLDDHIYSVKVNRE